MSARWRSRQIFFWQRGLDEDVEPVMVTSDRTVTNGTYPQANELNGGFTVVDVPSREAALDWAAKIAATISASRNSSTRLSNHARSSAGYSSFGHSTAAEEVG